MRVSQPTSPFHHHFDLKPKRAQLTPPQPHAIYYYYDDNDQLQPKVMGLNSTKVEQHRSATVWIETWRRQWTRAGWHHQSASYYS